jgi:protein FAM32A
MTRLKQKIEMQDPDLMISHRQKIEEYNKKLANLPEHNDIPKVGPG